MGCGETMEAGVFVLSQAASATAWTANWFVEPKYTGQEDLPPGFRGEAPSLDARSKDDSQPMQCQTVDPSALVCSTVRASGFDMFQELSQEQYAVFHRRAFDEIQGRAPFVSDDNKFLGFWCENAASWRLTIMEHEQLARDGSCEALAASTGGVQFKDAAGWHQSSASLGKVAFDFEVEALPEGITKNDESLLEIQVGDDWVHAADITCR